MKVTFTHRNGRVKQMSLQNARIFEKLGHGTYTTRAMVAEPVVPVLLKPVHIPVVEQEDTPVPAFSSNGKFVKEEEKDAEPKKRGRKPKAEE